MLNNLSVGKLENTSIYAIGIGLVVYACIYLYFLFYNEEFLSMFNKFIIYVIGIDLLLASFYYAHNKNSLEYTNLESIDNSEDVSEDISEDVSEDVSQDNNVEDNIFEELHIHEENDLNIEEEENSDVESVFEFEQTLTPPPTPTQEPSSILESLIQEPIVREAAPVEQLEDFENLETVESLDTVLQQASKKRRGRKPNVAKLVL